MATEGHLNATNLNFTNSWQMDASVENEVILKKHDDSKGSGSSSEDGVIISGLAKCTVADQAR